VSVLFHTKKTATFYKKIGPKENAISHKKTLYKKLGQKNMQQLYSGYDGVVMGVIWV
jgi:hypothetical protein